VVSLQPAHRAPHVHNVEQGGAHGGVGAEGAVGGGAADEHHDGLPQVPRLVQLHQAPHAEEGAHLESLRRKLLEY
jgi:hypothetical protein